MFINRALENYLDSPQRILKNILLRRVKHQSKKSHVFILGAPRSGTTLLQTLVSSHPNFHGIDQETALLTHQNVFKSEWRKTLHSAALANKMIWDSDDIVQLFDTFSDAMTERAVKKDSRFVEKTPQHVNYLDNILRWFPHAQILHIHRDGRDCYCSARKHKGIPTGSALNSYAQYWKRCIESRLKHSEHPRIHDVSYENLTKDPEKTLARIMEFLGDKLDATQLENHKRKNDKRSSQKEFSKLGDPVDTASVGRWRIELTKDEIIAYEKITKKELQALGYKLEHT